MFTFRNLDSQTRQLMLAEAESDRLRISEYYGRRLSEQGRDDWSQLLRLAIELHDCNWLAAELTRLGRLISYESYVRDGQTSERRVPRNAAEVLAQGEFNRYYIRAICLRAISDGSGRVRVYRARFSENPRPESEAAIGEIIKAKLLLEDLRSHPGEETVLGIPLVNSGLSVELIALVPA